MTRKFRWIYRWVDMPRAFYEYGPSSNHIGPISRDRVAYLLRAARSRRGLIDENLHRIPAGYQSRTLQLLRRRT